MPRSKKSHVKKGSKGEAMLGPGVGGTVVAVPRSLRSTITARISGLDYIRQGSGAYSLVFNSSAGPTVGLGQNWLDLSLDWPKYSDLYDEFRVSMLEVRFATFLSTNAAPYLLVYDNNGVSVTPDIPTFSSYSTAKLMSTTYDGELSYQIPPPATGQWYPTGDPGLAAFKPGLGIVTASPGGPSTPASGVTYVALLFSFTVEFRGLV